jgi:transposase
VVSRSTLLRLLRALPVPRVGSLAAVGVDDFAFRRGHTYGTVLIDMHTRQPVELLADRLSETFAEWLRTHPGAEVICRDRAGSYAEGARVGAPNAIQVADRWHLFRNLSDAVDRVARNHRGCLREQAEQPTDQPAAAAASTLSSTVAADGIETMSGRRALVTRQRHAEVHALLERGMSLHAISRQLQMQRNTVRRYARASTAEEMLTQNPKRGSQLDPFTGYLAMRWGQDCTNAVELTAEIRRRGYRGSERSVRDLVSTWRTNPDPPSPTPVRPPTSRQVTMLMMRPRHKLTADEHQRCTTYLTAARHCARSTSWSATSPEWLASVKASTSTPGSPPPKPATARSCAGSLTACSPTTTPSAPASPFPGAAARSKETSPGSRRSSDRCTDGRTSICSAAASYSHTDQPTRDHAMCQRPVGPSRKGCFWRFGQ